MLLKTYHVTIQKGGETVHPVWFSVENAQSLERSSLLPRYVAALQIRWLSPNAPRQAIRWA